MASRLRDGGVVLLDGPDPAHSTAPRDASAIDPAMLRWVSPDTAALLCEAAGLSDIHAVPVGNEDATGRAPWYVVVARR
jgi:hypothetical protein